MYKQQIGKYYNKYRELFQFRDVFYKFSPLEKETCAQKVEKLVALMEKSQQMFNKLVIFDLAKNNRFQISKNLPRVFCEQAKRKSDILAIQEYLKEDASFQNLGLDFKKLMALEKSLSGLNVRF